MTRLDQRHFPIGAAVAANRRAGNGQRLEKVPDDAPGSALRPITNPVFLGRLGR